MHITDGQIHFTDLVDTDRALCAMDALGIQSALIDEFLGYANDTGNPQPGYLLPDGICRPWAPEALQASINHPDRFAWLLRVSLQDPDVRNWVSFLKGLPQFRALRVDVRTDAEIKLLREDVRLPLFQAADSFGLPVFVVIHPGIGTLNLIEHHIRSWPSVAFVIDHCGLASTDADYDYVLSLAQYENALLKWCHAPSVFHSNGYPFETARTALGRALDAFGCRRIIWASDFTVIEQASRLHGCEPYSWAEALFYVRDNSLLSEDDKQWVLGRSLRTLIGWHPT